MKKFNNGPKILLLDVETSPILAHVWGLWENDVALNQIERDWFILSFSAKWLGDAENKIIYKDQRNAKDIEDDSILLKDIWTLMDHADVVVGQNSNKFDIKKLNARFILNGMQPPSSYKKIDTCVLAKKHFAFTSNKLEYLSENLCKKYKKLVDKKFTGFKLWSECLKGNIKAWREMERYNKLDVLSLEELYTKLIPWDNSLNFNLYTDDLDNVCKCGNKEFKKNGYAYTASGKFQRFKCVSCGSETRDKKNLLTKEKKASLRVGTVR
jgi:hypothetical protein